MLDRNSDWTEVSSETLDFLTHHPQGMARVGDHLFVSSVEVIEPTERYDAPRDGMDRSAGAGVGHLFKMTLDGELVGRITLGEGDVYHPGGIDFDGAHLWVPVAGVPPELGLDRLPRRSRDTGGRGGLPLRRPPGRPAPRPGERHAARRELGIAAPLHLHARRGRLRAGSRRPARGGHDPEPVALRRLPGLPPRRAGRALCTGVAVYDVNGARFNLGGLDLVDLEAGRPIHQTPIPLWTEDGLDLAHNPVWIETTATGLRGYFLPEDDESRLFVYDVALED
jgi:hypothetical protein